MGTQLDVRRIRKVYGPVEALCDVSITIERGEIMCLLGPSGSGKTTLLQLIAGVTAPTEGCIFLGGRDVTRIPVHERNIGYVMQGSSLFPHLSVYDNIAFPLRTTSHRTNAADIPRRVTEIMAMTGLGGLERRKPHELSGGQQQRAALARALVFNPDVLLLDEPLGALDRELREKMQDEIRRLQHELGTTVLYVTHDQTEAMAVAHRIAIVNAGHIEQIGTPFVLYRQPRNRFIASFLGGANCFSGRVSAITEGSVSVNACGGNVEVIPNGALNVGFNLMLMVRPERIRIGKPLSEGWNTVHGAIQRIIFLGGIVRIWSKLSDSTLWRADISAHCTPVEQMSIGSDVCLSWRIEDTHVFEDNRSAN